MEALCSIKTLISNFHLIYMFSCLLVRRSGFWKLVCVCVCVYVVFSDHHIFKTKEERSTKFYIQYQVNAQMRNESYYRLHNSRVNQGIKNLENKAHREPEMSVKKRTSKTAPNDFLQTRYIFSLLAIRCI